MQEKTDFVDIRTETGVYDLGRTETFRDFAVTGKTTRENFESRLKEYFPGCDIVESVSKLAARYDMTEDNFRKMVHKYSAPLISDGPLWAGRSEDINEWLYEIGVDRIRKENKAWTPSSRSVIKDISMRDRIRLLVVLKDDLYYRSHWGQEAARDWMENPDID